VRNLIIGVLFQLVRNDQTTQNLLPWLVIVLLAQSAWGAYPVLARYLQITSDLPTMSIIALGNLIALIVLGGLLLPRLRLEDLRSHRLLIFALLVIGRGITNFLASRYTLATYVLLITLLTPFIVALLSKLVWREPLPKYTGRALMLGLCGVLLIIGTDLFAAWPLQDTARADWLGISLAAFSSLILALYLISVRRSMVHNIRAEALLIVQLLSLTVAGFVLSLIIGEPWHQWRSLGTMDWGVFGVMVFGVLIGANMGQIGSIRHLGAALVSSTMPWRLVSVLIVSAILLDERLSSPMQLAGVVIVIVTVSWYLWQQR
jgi:drug/metabolite transporter (DMT)-like permease